MEFGFKLVGQTSLVTGCESQNGTRGSPGSRWVYPLVGFSLAQPAQGDHLSEKLMKCEESDSGVEKLIIANFTFALDQCLRATLYRLF